MKSLKSLFAVAAAAIALTIGLAPTEVQAGHRDHNHGYRQTSTCGQCHQPVYAQYRIVGYESCGEPIWRWVPVKHRCSGRSSHQGHAHHDSHAGHNHGRFPPRPNIHFMLNRIFNR